MWFKRKTIPVSKQIEHELHLTELELLNAEGFLENAEAHRDKLKRRVNRLRDSLLPQQIREGDLCMHGENPDDCPVCRH